MSLFCVHVTGQQASQTSCSAAQRKMCKETALPISDAPRCCSGHRTPIWPPSGPFAAGRPHTVPQTPGLDESLHRCAGAPVCCHLTAPCTTRWRPVLLRPRIHSLHDPAGAPLCCHGRPPGMMQLQERSRLASQHCWQQVCTSTKES